MELQQNKYQMFMSTRRITIKFFAATFILILSNINVDAQSISELAKETKNKAIELVDSIPVDSTKIDSIIRHESKFRQALKRLGGFSIAADVFGPIQMLVSDYGQIEGALKIDIKGTYYPTIELGLGRCDLTDDNTQNSYKTTAPFFRIGVDVNLLSNKQQRNKLFAGARYGFSSFNYDISGPAIVDPVFGGSEAFSYIGLKSKCHWLEFVLGVQAQIWHGFHMGWSVRYKAYVKLDESIYSKPYYIPGYGTTTNSSCWGATYTLIWDVKL